MICNENFDQSDESYLLDKILERNAELLQSLSVGTSALEIAKGVKQSTTLHTKPLSEI